TRSIGPVVPLAGARTGDPRGSRPRSSQAPAPPCPMRPVETAEAMFLRPAKPEVPMRSILVRSLLVASMMAFAPVGVRADGDSDIGGDWQFRIAGQRGFAALKFGTPNFGTFTVAGVGFS